MAKVKVTMRGYFINYVSDPCNLKSKSNQALTLEEKSGEPLRSKRKLAETETKTKSLKWSFILNSVSDVSEHRLFVVNNAAFHS